MSWAERQSLQDPLQLGGGGQLGWGAEVLSEMMLMDSMGVGETGHGRAISELTGTQSCKAGPALCPC